jgi:hypothetical protein
MYFWRINALTEQLRRGPLDQRGALLYLLAWLMAWTVATLPWMSGDATALNLSDWVSQLSYVVATVIGTLLAYRANGGANGNDFAARYLAVGWVVTVRLMVLFLLPLFVLVFTGQFLATFLAVSRGGDASVNDTATAWGIAAIAIVFEIVYYWRLMHHLSVVNNTNR